MSIVGDDLAFSWNQVDEQTKSFLDFVQVAKDVGMIELDRRENNGLGKVVEEFRAFIEKCSVVFVAFQDEMFSLSQSKAAAEIFCDATDEKRGIFLCGLENPGQHGRRSGLAMGACHY